MMDEQLTANELEILINLASAGERYTPEQYAAIKSAERVLTKATRNTAPPWTCTHCKKGELVVGRSGSDYEVMCSACRTVVTTCYDEYTAHRYVGHLLAKQSGQQAGE